jgi:hypothetical protein
MRDETAHASEAAPIRPPLTYLELICMWGDCPAAALALSCSHSSHDIDGQTIPHEVLYPISPLRL